MYNIFYKLYFFKFNNNAIDKVYSRIFVRIFNFIIPIFFKLTNKFIKYSINDIKRDNHDESYIVSLTTFPARINKVWLTIETILRQKVSPDKVILWLYKGEFQESSSLPKEIQQQENRGLQIMFCEENLYPHKKYFYTIQKYPKANVITIDDDKFYPPDFLIKIINKHKKFPKSICSFINRKITIKDNYLNSYNKWKYYNINSQPEINLLPIGVGGVLYPPKSLSNEVFNKKSLIELSLKADDLWLRIMSLKNNTKVVGLGGEYSRYFISVFHKNKIKLMDSNIGESKNDEILKKLVNHYDIPIEIFNNEQQ